jgi:predicted transcriptional regulator/transcriptional regulator with XRE-family HTH domain
VARTLIGKKIRDRRKAQGITQAALAERLGISASYLNLIEGNRRNIAGALLKRIADALAVPLDEFDGAAERRLVDDLGEIAVDALVAPLRLAPASAADLAAQHPGWARALVALHRAGVDHQQTVIALSDRLNQDPFLGDAVHSMLSKLTAIRSASEILESVGELEPAQRRRFVSMIADDSRRLSDVAQALAAFFNKAHTATRSITPVEEVDDFVFENDNYFPQLEAAADALRAAAASTGAPVDAAFAAYLERVHAVRMKTVAASDLNVGPLLRSATRFDREARVVELLDVAPATTRRFELAGVAAELACGDLIAAELDRTTLLGSPAARRRAERALLSYVAGAVLLPYDIFQPAAAAARYDIDTLARRFGASFEQVCHRLVSLRRPGAEGIRFGFMRADPAGFVTKRFPLPQLPLPRYGNACPLWAIYKAFQTPGATVRQLAEFPGGERYLMLARAIEKDGSAFRMPQRFMSIMLFCNALQADQLVYGDGLDLSPAAPATPVGQTCRVCTRRECAWREEDPIIDAGMY